MRTEEIVRYWRCEGGLTLDKSTPPSPAGTIELPGALSGCRGGASKNPGLTLSEPGGNPATWDCGHGTFGPDCFTVPLDNTFGCCLPQPWEPGAMRDN